MSDQRKTPDPRRRHGGPLGRILLAVGAVAVAAGTLAAPARAQDAQDWCAQTRGGRDAARRYCEVRELTLKAPSGGLDVDAQPNGGIRVRAAERADVRVQARVQARAGSVGEAKALAGRVAIDTEGGRVRAQGPDTHRDSWWSVSYRIEAPPATDLSLQAQNGGISIEGMKGRTRFRTLNGGVDLRHLAGEVSGSTTNGGLDIVLAGRTWEGAGLDVRTTNGGIDLAVPDGYAAHLVTSTVNGGVDLGFPVTVQGRIGRRLSVDLGGGGPTIRARTTNGGVDLHRP